MASNLDDIVNQVWLDFDFDKSGTLNVGDAEAFYRVLMKERPDLGLNEDAFNDWFDAIDLDLDGTITKDELKHYLQSISYQK